MNQVVHRNGRLTAVLTSFAAAAVVLIATLGFASRAEAQPFETGVFDSGAYLGTDSQIPYSRTRAAGGHYVKTFLYWDTIAPGAEPASWNPRDPGDGHYSFGALDTMVKRAKKAGLQPVVAVLGTPNWARADPGCTAGNACAPKLDALGDFTHALATRYKGNYQGIPAVTYWELWSEPNLDYFLEPTSATLYRSMVATMSSEIKAVNRRARTIAGGLAPLGNDSAVAPLKFMRTMLCMRGRARPKPSCAQKSTFDIWGTNPYTTGNAFHSAHAPDDVSLGDLPQMNTLLRAADKAKHIRSVYGRVPFWVTEFSWDTRAPDSKGVPLLRHRRWVAEAFHQMYTSGVSAGFWFLLRDQANMGRSDHDTYQSGLYFHGATVARDRPKPSLSAFAFPFTALRARRGVEVWGRTPNGKRGAVIIKYRSRGGYRTVARVRANRFGVFRRVLRLRKRGGTFKATYRGKTAPPFALMKDREVFQPPFGRIAGPGING